MVPAILMELRIAAMVLSVQCSSPSVNGFGLGTKLSYADIVFALDYSGSTSDDDFKNLKTALLSVTNVLNIGKDKIHMGIIIYNCTAHEHLRLSEGTSNETVHQSILHLPRPNDGWNLIGEAMDKAQKMFTKEARNGSIRIFVLISDGFTECLPFKLAPCFGTLEEWNVAQCRIKSQQCARPKQYRCKIPYNWPGCPNLTKATGDNSAVYNQAENLKAGLGVKLVTVRMGTCKDNKIRKCDVNMKCWANDNMSFWVEDTDGLVRELADTVSKVMKINPPKDCRYFWQEKKQCETNSSGKGTMYECTKTLTAVKLADEEPGGNGCPKDKVQPCNLEDCYNNMTGKGSVVYYAIKIIQVKRKPQKESSLLLIVMAGLILSLVGTIAGIVVLAVLLRRRRRRGKSIGIQMTKREEPRPRRRGRRARGGREADMGLSELEKQPYMEY